MSTPADHRPPFSDAHTSSDRYESGSDDGTSHNWEDFREQYLKYARETTFVPQPTVGFGKSEFGPRPEQIKVANSGPAKGLRAAYRKDLEPLVRWDPRDYEEVFKFGFRPHNDKRPSSFNYYQAEMTETALVSTSRDATFDEEGPRPAWAFNNEGHFPRYTINAPGGYDFVASLNTSAYVNQQEVAFWKGIRPEYISGVTIFDRDGSIVAEHSNPNAHAAHEVEERRQQEQQQAWEEYQKYKETHRQQSSEETVPAHVAYQAALDAGDDWAAKYWLTKWKEEHAQQEATSSHQQQPTQQNLSSNLQSSEETVPAHVAYQAALDAGDDRAAKYWLTKWKEEHAQQEATSSHQQQPTQQGTASHADLYGQTDPAQTVAYSYNPQAVAYSSFPQDIATFASSHQEILPARTEATSSTELESSGKAKSHGKKPSNHGQRH
ncbi:hypothetical protein [Streptomyces niveus]|uniref:scabin-related ADP-ribosyltransferase n=1 Tax=Streptomyces niveus TaxID=193462 RepID=UPI0036D4200E